MKTAISEENSEQIHQEETAAVVSMQQDDLRRVRNRNLGRSLSPGYESQEDDLTDKIPDDTNDLSMSLGTKEFDVGPHCTKDFSLSKQGTIDFSDLKDELKKIELEDKSEISAKEQPLGIELFGSAVWLSEVPEVEYPVDRNCSKDEKLSSIPASDLRKLDNITPQSDPVTNISKQNFDYTEDLKAFSAALDSGPDVNKLMDKNCDTLEDKIHCHKISLEKIIADILQMTKEAEDSAEDSEKMASVFDDLLEFNQEVEFPDDPSLKNLFPDKSICDSEECPEGVRKPSETSSDFLNKVSSSVHFFHGFCGAHQARPSPVSQTCGVADVGTSSYDPWYNSMGCQSSEQRFHPLAPSQNSLSPEQNSSDFKIKLWHYKAQEETLQPKNQFYQLWPIEEPDLSGQRAHSASESKVQKLQETSYRKRSSDFAGKSSPVEDFVNSLYLPKDLLPSEMTYSAALKRTRAPADDRLNTTKPSSSDDRTKTTKSGSSERSLAPQSKKDHIEKVGASEVHNTRIWGNEKQTYWKPLPMCPATSSESDGQRSNRAADNSRRGRKAKSGPFSTARHPSKTRGGWSGSYQRKYY